MAAITRRTWANIRDEVIKRLGNITATGFSGRVEYSVWAAYQDIATTYHHFELDDVDTSLTCSTSTNDVSLTAGTFMVIGVRLKSVAGAVLTGLESVDFRRLSDDYLATSGRPTQYSRFLNKLYFDKKPDLAYPLEVYRYKRCTAPDFSSTSPELDSDVDEHIIEAACRKLFPMIARPDIGEVNRQLMTEWLSMNVRPSLIDEPLPNMSERSRSATALAGAQGA